MSTTIPALVEYVGRRRTDHPAGTIAALLDRDDITPADRARAAETLGLTQDDEEDAA